MEVINQVTLLSIILTGAAVIREREHGTLEHLMVMPLPPVQIMAPRSGRTVSSSSSRRRSRWCRGAGALGVPIAGSIALFLLGTMLHLFSTTSIGILLATMARSMPQLGLLIFLVISAVQCSRAR